MTRLLVLGMLLHHIEGVCKPWTAAVLAVQAAAAGLANHVANRDQAAAVERARTHRAAAIDRARSAATRVIHRPGRRRQPEAIEPKPAVVDGFVYRITDAVERDR